MLRKRLFDALAALAARYSWAVLLGAIGLTAICIALTTRIEVRTNFKDLLGPDDPVAERMGRLEQQFPVVSSVRVLIEGDDPDRLIAAGGALAERLEARPEEVRHTWFELPVDFFVEHALLYMAPDDLRLMNSALTERQALMQALLADPSTLGLTRVLDDMMQDQARPASAVATVNARLFGELDLGESSSNAADVGLRLNTDPLARQLQKQALDTIRPLPLPGSEGEVLSDLEGATQLFSLIADVLEQGEALPPEEFTARVVALRDLNTARMGMPTERYAMSPDGQALLLDVAAVAPILNNADAIPFIDFMEGELDEVRRSYPDVTLTLSGMPVLFKQESEAILNNFVLVTLLGFLGIVAVFIIGFERIGLPSLSAIPLLMGVAWTFGLVTAVNGGLTLFAMTFPVLLLGLGIDFAIHLLAAYSEQRRAIDDPEEALKGAFEKIGAGLLTGALTTAMAFLVLTQAKFFGLRDMGFTAGVGVLMALLSMVIVLPAIVILYDRRQQAQGSLLPDVPFPFLEPLGRRIQSQRYLVLAGFLVATLVFAYFVPSAQMDENYLHQLPEGLPALDAQERTLEKFGSSNEMIAFIASDLEEVERIRLAAERSPSVGEVLAPTALIPVDQAKKAPLITELGQMLEGLAPPETPAPRSYGPEEIEALRDHLASVKLSALQLSMLSATLYGEDVQAAAGELRDVINRIDARIDLASAQRLVTLDALLAAEISEGYALLLRTAKNTSLQPEDLPASLLAQLQGDDGSWLVMVRGNQDAWDSAFRHQLLGDLKRISPEHVGMITAWDRGLSMLLTELPRMFAWTALVVFGLVFVDLRSFRATAIACMPLCIGLIWTVGAMAMLGVPFNMLSVVAIPLLVGIGIDSGVHVYHRIHKEHSIPDGLSLSGKPVLLTSMTTTIGFGSLMLSVHAGFRGLGLATAIGIVASLLASLLLLPALVAIFDEDSLKEPEA